MAVGSQLQTTIKEWGVLVMFVVIISVVLLKFKDVGGVTLGLNTTIDTFVSAFSEPKNWVTIVIIAIIGISLLAMFYKMKSK